jgi:hypothetical protein
LQLELVNSYVLDPAHIAPSRSDANSNGHFPMGNHVQATGTPRGFNLANMSMGMGGNGMNTMNAGSMFNPAMGGSWDAAAGMHDAGAMRRGGQRFNNRTGPYDRQNRDRRNVFLPAVRAAALRLRVVDDRACNVTVMAGQGPYSPPKVVKSRATKTLMLWAGTAVAS